MTFCALNQCFVADDVGHCRLHYIDCHLDCIEENVGIVDSVVEVGGDIVDVKDVRSCWKEVMGDPDDDAEVVDEDSRDLLLLFQLAH